LTESDSGLNKCKTLSPYPQTWSDLCFNEKFVTETLSTLVIVARQIGLVEAYVSLAIPAGVTCSLGLLGFCTSLLATNVLTERPF
jgi:hypothetical protein